MTQNELVEMWQKKSGKSVKTVKVSAADMEKTIATSTAPDPAMMLVLTQLHRSMWIRGDCVKRAGSALTRPTSIRTSDSRPSSRDCPSCSRTAGRRGRHAPARRPLPPRSRQALRRTAPPAQRQRLCSTSPRKTQTAEGGNPRPFVVLRVGRQGAFGGPDCRCPLVVGTVPTRPNPGVTPLGGLAFPGVGAERFWVAVSERWALPGLDIAVARPAPDETSAVGAAAGPPAVGSAP